MSELRSTVATTVATFSDLEKAVLVKNRLERAGIHAEVNDESTLQKLWFLSKPLAGEKVVVDEKDFDRALEILKIADAEDRILAGEIRCPECGSAEVQYPQFTRKFLMTNLVGVLCYFGIIDKKFYCKKCHNAWPTRDTLRPQNDVLKWPDKGSGFVKKEKGVNV